MSLRLRLTIFYTSLLGATLLAFSALLYLVLETSLVAEVDQGLRKSAVEVHRALAATATVTDLRTMTVLIFDALPVREFATPGIYVQVIDSHGRVVARSANLRSESMPIEPTALDEAMAMGDVIVTVDAGGGDHLRIHTSPITVNDQVVGFVQVGQSLHNVDVTMRQVFVLLVLGIASTMVAAGLGIWVLTQRALRPLEVIVRTADRISGASDLRQRIALHGPNDEVGQLARAFNRMMDRLERAFLAHKQFVADSSHELRTPLTVIRGNVDLLKRNPDPECFKESLAAIESETACMSRIVEDLLTLAQLDEPQVGERKPVAIDELALQALRQGQVLASDHQTVTLGRVDAALVYGDPDRLAQMMRNLVENAVKYTPSGGTITIDAYVLPDEQAWAATLVAQEPRVITAPRPPAFPVVMLSVRDTGIGIATEDLPHVFDRFYRVDKARSRASGGTGLGLAIVKGIAETHGGVVVVHSEVGKGSVFAVLLPEIMPRGITEGEDAYDDTPQW